MNDPARHLRALERAAAAAHRTLENRIVRVDEAWDDQVRRAFEAEHLAAIRSEARLLRVGLGTIAETAEHATRELASNY